MNPIADIAKGLIGPVTDLLAEVITDKDERNRLANQIATLTATHAHEQAMGQMRVNEQQAKHSSLFVAGARPAIMWICAFALAYNTIVHPIAGIWVADMPPVDGSLLYPVLMGLLGLTASRSYEKARGVARESLR